MVFIKVEQFRVDQRSGWWHRRVFSGDETQRVLGFAKEFLNGIGGFNGFIFNVVEMKPNARVGRRVVYCGLRNRCK